MGRSIIPIAPTPIRSLRINEVTLMAQRIYISKLIGDGLTLQTAFRPAWMELISNPSKTGQAIEAEKHNFWIGQLETTGAEHALLIADPRIRHIAPGLMNVPLSTVTQNDKNTINEIFSWLGFANNIDNLRVSDMLAIINGRCLWHPIKQAEES